MSAPVIRAASFADFQLEQVADADMVIVGTRVLKDREGLDQREATPAELERAVWVRGRAVA